MASITTWPMGTGGPNHSWTLGLWLFLSLTLTLTVLTQPLHPATECTHSAHFKCYLEMEGGSEVLKGFRFRGMENAMGEEMVMSGFTGGSGCEGEAAHGALLETSHMVAQCFPSHCGCGSSTGKGSVKF